MRCACWLVRRRYISPFALRSTRREWVGVIRSEHKQNRCEDANLVVGRKQADQESAKPYNDDGHREHRLAADPVTEMPEDCSAEHVLRLQQRYQIRGVRDVARAPHPPEQTSSWGLGLPSARTGAPVRRLRARPSLTRLRQEGSSEFASARRCPCMARRRPARTYSARSPLHCQARRSIRH